MTTKTRSRLSRTDSLPPQVSVRLEELGVTGCIVLHPSARSGRCVWELQADDAASTADAASKVANTARMFIKMFESAAPYERERSALRQMPPGFAPRLIAEMPALSVLMTEALPGRPLGAAPQGREYLWLESCVAPILASIALPGPWPDEPMVILTRAQGLVAAELVAREPRAAEELGFVIGEHLRIPCHGDVSASNLLVDDESGDSPRGWLLDFEFYGSGDVLADLAALCLTPSVSVPRDDRMRLLRKACSATEARTGLRLAHRLSGSIALWAVQCAAWHRLNPDIDGGEATVRKTLDLAAASIADLKGATT